MRFQKGNPGKPKGAKHKKTLELRDAITNFLKRNFDRVQADFDVLEPKDRMRLYCDLLQYGVPKLQAVSNTIGFENMSDEQLEEVVNQLKEKAA